MREMPVRASSRSSVVSQTTIDTAGERARARPRRRTSSDARAMTMMMTLLIASRRSRRVRRASTSGDSTPRDIFNDAGPRSVGTRGTRTTQSIARIVAPTRRMSSSERVRRARTYIDRTHTSRRRRRSRASVGVGRVSSRHTQVRSRRARV